MGASSRGTLVVRILGTIPVVIISSVLIFIAMRIIPGNPVDVLAGGQPLTHAQKLALTKQYGFDKPLYVQYFDWLGGAIHGDLGQSLLRNQSVSSLIGDALPRTVALLVGAFAIALVVSVIFGTLAAVREGTAIDQAVISGTMLLLSVPLFISCGLAIFIFSDTLGWLPAFGFQSPLGDGGDIGLFISHMILPWSTLGVALVAVQTATLRAGLVDALHQEYVLMARSRGLPEWKVIAKHGARTALVPVVTLLGLQLSYMIVGSVFVDYIFGLGGIGSLLVNSVNLRDLPVVQGCVMVVAGFFIIANLAVDMLASRLDIRYAVR